VKSLVLFVYLCLTIFNGIDTFHEKKWHVTLWVNGIHGLWQGENTLKKHIIVQRLTH
jgi:hypothetical protein